MKRFKVSYSLLSDTKKDSRYVIVEAEDATDAKKKAVSLIREKHPASKTQLISEAWETWERN